MDIERGRVNVQGHFQIYYRKLKLDVVIRERCLILRIQQIILFSVLRKSRMRLFQWRTEKQRRSSHCVKGVKRQKYRGQGGLVM